MASGDRQSSDLRTADVVREVRRHEGGVDAETLTARLENKGYAPRVVRQLTQRSLDEGALRLGPGLRLVVPKKGA